MKGMKDKYTGPLSEAERQFIRENVRTMQHRELVKRMKRGGKTINDFIRHEGLKNLDGSKDTRNHPWRKANYQLEVSKTKVRSCEGQ